MSIGGMWEDCKDVWYLTGARKGRLQAEIRSILQAEADKGGGGHRARAGSSKGRLR